MSASILDPLVSLLNDSSLGCQITRSGSGSLARMARALFNQGNSVVIVAKTAKQLSEFRSLLTLFSSSASTAQARPEQTQWGRAFITLPSSPHQISAKSGWADRMAALYALANRRDIQGVVVTLDNFLLKYPPTSIFDTHELVLTKGMEMAPEMVLEQAIDWGYVRSPMVSVPGDIAVRGDILDIFCPGYQKPLRLEFFGDTLDDIRLFEASSQRSIIACPEIIILPVAPLIASRAYSEKALELWEKEQKSGELTKEGLTALKRALESSPSQILPGMFYEQTSTLFDWLPEKAFYLLPDEKSCFMELENLDRIISGQLSDMAETTELSQPRHRVLFPVAEVIAHIEQKKRYSFDELRIGGDLDVREHSLPEMRYDSFQEIFPHRDAAERPWQYLVALLKNWSVACASSEKQKGKMPQGGEGRAVVSAETPLGKQLLEWFPKTAGMAVNDQLPPGACGKLILSFANDRSREKFLKLAEQDGIFPKTRYEETDNGIFALVSPFRAGLTFGWEHTLVLGEDVVQPRVERAKRLPRAAFQGLDRFDDLKEQDFLVHRDYGVASFGGLQRMQLGGIESDYLLLYYAGNDKLYLPVDRLSLIQRFKGADGADPVLDKLGGNLWSSSKEKARKAIEKIAADLIEMYALRKVVKGFRYSPINEMYREFEATFGFEETPDQAKAIDDVLRDMEKAEPMDRLVCGDVGFGKTEVALRAAFRCAAEGRQVALLCPTTILAEQHYQTFRSRLSGFPINVGLLSRFVSKTKQKEVLAATAKGQIDILIGTHRLLSKDVVLPSLGLLILDEEQRFGVRHKERLKEMRKNVDALTLTATPIPRTLQLSLSGIRELSVIETPPPERKPVTTALIDRDDAALRQIVEKEIARQGQVFWVYNRVQGLERVVEYVRKLVPTARIGMAHGQMNETTLESTMHAFWHGDLDVLVCTSIVESGLDFPRANTLIVDQAQLFGLGQLYQLRGRVGRSDQQAFAVFVTPNPDKLPETARQRMRIILDMDYLGAGFQVAMEDLRLRGAGNILGESQSGHMNRLGLDLFLEMLEEAVAKLKGQHIETVTETELNLGVPALIPTGYMQDAKERLRYYKLLSSAQDDATQQDIEFELRDRFGPLPPELQNFVSILHFKRLATRCGIAKADILPEKVRLTFSENSTVVDPADLVQLVTEQQAKGYKTRLLPPAILELHLADHSVTDSMVAVENILQTLTAKNRPQIQ